MNSNLRLAAVLAALVAVWMLTGFFKASKEEEKQEQSEEQDLFEVQVADSQAQAFRRPVYLRARSEAERRVAVAAEVDGRIQATPQKEGQWVEQGAVLCSLASEDRQLRLEQAQAQLSKAQLDYDAASKLKSSGYQSRSQIAAAKANLAVAEAELKRNQNVLDHLQVRAPFAGVLEKRHKEVGDFIQRGSPCATVLELDPLVVSGHLSERDIRSLSLGDSAQVRFIDGEERTGRVRYLASSADELTRSYRVEVEVENKDHSLVSGLAADVSIHAAELPAHLISPALLTLMDKGVIGVRSLDANNKVQIHEVQLLADDKEGVWISGLPEQVTLIVVGQEYVSIGQQVLPVEQRSKKAVEVELEQPNKASEPELESEQGTQS
ncbi:efflux RND transporter periplasmic adaptor subunit [Agaribacterium sp. ZY112]|uniref:efflux RND transporter periplasmic adaptor subunit n=1 Tax=Agaribacterium sp. ZY112 TaxID=3233574 RepID=UPI0035261353